MIPRRSQRTQRRIILRLILKALGELRVLRGANPALKKIA
jgi:hypothetical protein